jgi:hypothetical protein
MMMREDGQSMCPASLRLQLMQVQHSIQALAYSCLQSNISIGQGQTKLVKVKTDLHTCLWMHMGVVRRLSAHSRSTL